MEGGVLKNLSREERIKVRRARQTWREWSHQHKIRVYDFDPTASLHEIRHLRTDYEQCIAEIPHELIGMQVAAECYWSIKARYNSLIESRRKPHPCAGCREATGPGAVFCDDCRVVSMAS